MSRPARPDTNGAAAEVPQKRASTLSWASSAAPHAGAITPTQGPRFEKSATVPSGPAAPTASTPAYAAGNLGSETVIAGGRHNDDPGGDSATDRGALRVGMEIGAETEIDHDCPARDGTIDRLRDVVRRDVAVRGDLQREDATAPAHAGEAAAIRTGRGDDPRHLRAVPDGIAPGRSPDDALGVDAPCEVRSDVDAGVDHRDQRTRRASRRDIPRSRADAPGRSPTGSSPGTGLRSARAEPRLLRRAPGAQQDTPRARPPQSHRNTNAQTFVQHRATAG